MIQIFQFDAENSALHAFKAHIVALEHMLIFFLSAPIAQHADCARVFGIVAGRHAAFAISAEIFARIEAERRQIADAADALALVLRAMRLTGVFNDDKPVLFSDRHDRVHVGWLAVKVNR